MTNNILTFLNQFSFGQPGYALENATYPEAEFLFSLSTFTAGHKLIYGLSIYHISS